MGLTSCTEDPATPMNVDMSEGKTANISGVLLANTDLTEDADDQNFTGVKTKIIVTVSYSELFNGGNGSWSTAIESDSKGMFSVTVPATAAGVNVSFAVNDVKGEVDEYIMEKKNLKLQIKIKI